MAHINEKSRKRKSKARERIEKRKQRREALTNIAGESLEKLPEIKLPGKSGAVSTAFNVIRDGIWYFRKNLPLALIAKVVGGFVLVVFVFFILTTIFSKNIGPGVTTMGLKLSGQTVDEATETLFIHWNETVTIDILVNGEVFEQVSPGDIGISLDATATAEEAKAVGLGGFPFGREIAPVITADYGDVQTYILNIANAIWIPSYEAGYEWRDGTLLSVQGTASRELDTVQSIDRIFDEPLAVINNGSVELVTMSTPPDVIEADPYYEDALAFVTGEFIIEGYDPFRDEFQPWRTTRQEMADWLIVTDTGITIREEGLEDFVNTVNSQLEVDNWSRYLDPSEVYESVSTAFVNDEMIADVRIRYADSTYTIQEGDWGLRLSRHLGLPFFNIQNVNPGTDWDTVYVGDNIAVPSRDLVIPLDPIDDRRIVVDLDRRYLVAYENNEVIYHWPISIGMTDAPTNPGIYQILSQVDIAYGSSFSLCNENSECGQWEMDYFMGIYEVGIGLTNGFHGAVRLPNGAYLDGGSLQLASTFGCVMSDNEQARLLYEWAETGIVVELLASDFPPESEPGRRALEFISEQT